MTLLSRLFLAIVLAAFAASSFAHAANSGAMAAEMIASDTTVTIMSGCEACGDADVDGKGIACNFVCNAGSFTAMLSPQMLSNFQSGSDVLATSVVHDFRGLTSPPAKQPPRTFI